ncbi:YhgE/Pip domain-containing protein [Gracilibacillus sp. S3-1-1]|uniref:YhgE/Pip domain-containing protein n=1 Tax=Gracilibacillus pellucidus TaxID=3095368 RepID=A0ACC6M4F3_9BACI|nr:YhgE/Pip domain-containing protein [Gracilibacillus sp. S3-1-1]MDX8045850.1 YhgE/Pip domain-containing protein [Gracilibacillus sp. S3-1-1]
MRIKRLLLLLMISVLVLSPFTMVSASTTPAKDEVVYTTLASTGEELDTYVVNSFEMNEEGEVVDYGDYTAVKNLTDLSEISQSGDEVSFEGSGDSFYYQGTLDNKSLPWKFSVDYKLNGEEMNPEEMLGKDGHLTLEIKTSTNKDANSVFIENYLLQISLTLDGDKYQQIKAEDATIANAGMNKQATFTVMPENDADFEIHADVTDFEMDGMEISAIPSSMSVDTPDVDDVTEDFETLADATAELDDGVGELVDGIADLTSGVTELKDGSSEYEKGIKQVSDGSSDLLSGSESIDQALKTMKNAMDQDVETGDFTALQTGLEQIAEGLQNASEGLATLQENYQAAYQALDQAIDNVPEASVSENEIAELYQSGADQEVLDKLVQSYEAAQVVKATYEQVREAFGAVSPTLEEVTSGHDEMASSLSTMAAQIAAASEGTDIQESLNELQQGLTSLSDNYAEFHTGLQQYTNGVDELANVYHDLHNGIVEVDNGTAEFGNGVKELHDGTTELADSTSDLPDQMQDEIDDMINDFDKSDFDAESFVSDKNNNVDSVQFVIQTEGVTKDESDDNEQEVEEEKSFWDRFLDLFR